MSALCVGGDRFETPRHNKIVDNDSYCCYIRCITVIVRIEGISKIGGTTYHAQLELLNKVRAIKDLVVCWLLHNLIPLDRKVRMAPVVLGCITWH